LGESILGSKVVARAGRKDLDGLGSGGLGRFGVFFGLAGVDMMAKGAYFRVTLRMPVVGGQAAGIAP
jgi:hypothetical protein